MKFQGDLLLTDPMYIIRKESGDDWNLLLAEGCDHAALHLLGIKQGLSFEAGDDAVRIVINDAGNVIGYFCSDSSLFCICDLKEVLTYNPDFISMNSGYPDSFCVIRNFNGEISILQDETGCQNMIGTGVNGFKTVIKNRIGGSP